MAPRSIRAPTNASIPDTLRVPSTAKPLLKSLLRLSKSSLIDLVLHWLLEENRATCAPYLASNRNLEEEVDEDYLWSPADYISELCLIYNRMRWENNVNKRYVIDRILDGDWRRGLSLYQVASIDFQSLSENDKALRWTALKLVHQGDEEDVEEEPLKKKRKMDPAPYPTISPGTFLKNLQIEISPLVKAHYRLHRMHAPHNLSIIRICVADSPYANPQSITQSSVLFTDPSRIIFIALPDSCPYIHVSVSGTARDPASTTKKGPLSTKADPTSLKRIVLEAIPRALSKSQHRYALKSTSLTTRSLSTMIALRGNSGTNAANGAYTIFAHGVVDNSPIDAQNPTFAQKIINACGGIEHQESNLSLSNLSLKPQPKAEKRTALVQRSTNLALTSSSRSKEDARDLKIAAITRFGLTGLAQTGPEPLEQNAAPTTGGLDRLQIRLDEDLHPRKTHACSDGHDIVHPEIDPFAQPPPTEPPPAPADVRRKASAPMTLTFQGSDIFLGLRQLVEAGGVNVEKLPAWMTGEEAVSGGTVRQGVVVRGMGGGA